MESGTQVIDLESRRAAREREIWLRELAAVQELSFQAMHVRHLDWNRLGDAAEEAAHLIALAASTPVGLAEAA